MAIGVTTVLPFENYPVSERHGFRSWTDKVYPCYDINNKHIGHMDNGTFYDMREGWYCIICRYETMSFSKALYHNIKHFLCVRKRHPSKKYNKDEYLK